jgi:hypothetical protein
MYPGWSESEIGDGVASAASDAGGLSYSIRREAAELDAAPDRQ